MIGIYEDSFKDYLENKIGSKVRINNKNIITKCPWCDLVNKSYSKKDHLWISIEAPIFHCFESGCEQSGFISKLVKKLEGYDISEKFVNKDIVRNNETNKNKYLDIHNYLIPKIDSDRFPNKTLYLKSRLKFSNIQIDQIKGLIFNIEEFININKINVDDRLKKMLSFLQSNFIGFITEHHNKIIFRNIDPTSSFRYYKHSLSNNNLFLDYYKINGLNRKSKTVVLSEGIFDIFPVKLFDSFNDNDIAMYCSALSSNYSQLLRSIVFHEQIFKIDLIILSDLNVEPWYYRKLKKVNEHIINSFTVYYNKNGKDFNNFPLSPVKFII